MKKSLYVYNIGINKDRLIGIFSLSELDKVKKLENCYIDYVVETKKSFERNKELHSQ